MRLSTFGAVWQCRYQSTAWVPSARNAKQEPLFQVQHSTSLLLPSNSLTLWWCWALESSVPCQLLLRPTFKCQALPFLSLSTGPTLFHPQCLLQLSFVCQQLSNFALQPRIVFWAPALPLGWKISMLLCGGTLGLTWPAWPWKRDLCKRWGVEDGNRDRGKRWITSFCMILENVQKQWRCLVVFQNRKIWTWMTQTCFFDPPWQENIT